MAQLQSRLEQRTKPVSFAASLSLTSAVTIGLGSLMGAGLYVLVGLGASAAGPGLWLAYAICGALTFLSCAMFADFARRIPRSGGAYVYAYDQLGSLWGFFVGWLLAVGSAFACALYATGFAQYLAAFAAPDIPLWATRLIGVGIVFVLGWLGTRGGPGAERVQRILTWGNVAVLAILTTVALTLWDSDNLTPHLPNGLDGITAAISLVYISFFGYQLIANSAEEVRDPARTVPKAMWLALGLATAIYLVVAFVAVAAVPAASLGASDAPLVDLAMAAIGGPGKILVGVGGVLAAGAALNGTLVSMGRQLYAMGRDRFLPNWTARVDKESGNPVAGIALGTVATAIVVGLADLAFIAKAANFSLLASMLPVSVALWRLHRDADEPPAPWQRAVPGLALLANAALLATLDAATFVTGGLVIAAGAAVYLTYSQAAERRGRAGVSIPLDDETSPGILRLGERVLIPVANPKTVPSLVSVAAALDPAADADLIALSVVPVPTGDDLRETLGTPEATADAVAALERALAQARGEAATIRPVVRASRSLSEGIVHGLREERCAVLVMGAVPRTDPDAPDIVGEVLRDARQVDAAILHLKADVDPRRIGVFLGARDNLQLMVRVASGLAERYDGRVTYISMVPESFGRADQQRARRIQTEALRRHATLVPWSIELHPCPDPLEEIVQTSSDYDLIVLGAGQSKLFGGSGIGEFADDVSRRAACSVILVRARAVIALPR